MLAANIMTTGVATLTPKDRVLDAISLLSVGNVSNIPVLDPDGRVVGVLTPEGIIRRGLTANNRGPGGNFDAFDVLAVRDVMDRGFLVVPPEAGMNAVADRLSGKEAGPVIVVDDGGRFLGVISAVDLLKRLWEYREKRIR